MPTIFRATVTLAAAPLISIAVACSSTTPTPAPDAAVQLCPVTIIEATSTTSADGGAFGDVCQVDGYICVVGFQCGNFTQQATCTCTIQTDSSEKWECVTANGAAVPDGVTDPTTLCLPAQGADANPCPSDTTTGQGEVCSDPGQQCYFAGVTCPNEQVPVTDVCQCKGNMTDAAGLSWQCDVHACQ